MLKVVVVIAIFLLELVLLLGGFGDVGYFFIRGFPLLQGEVSIFLLGWGMIVVGFFLVWMLGKITKHSK
jgi:hypothetical protein